MPNPLLRIPLPIAGLLALAVAMGIGRFAFTPILPLMQADAGLTLAEGGWLASANYLGYLVGALTIARMTWSAETLLRVGLWLVVITTAAMGLGSNWSGWLLWRFLAGLASGWVMVSTAALCIGRLTAAGRGEQSGIVFSGVGVGIMFAGLACMALALLRQSSASIWLWMAGAALAGLFGASMMWRVPESASQGGQNNATARGEDAVQNHGKNAATDHVPGPAPTSSSASSDASGSTSGSLHWGLIICYGVFGFGYILPATFLPAQTRLLIADPLVFSLTWPLFGLAAAVSTLITARLGQRYTQLQIWAGAQVIMAVGVFLPVVWHGLPALLIAAVCVGGTLLVITAAGLQEAQIVVGPAAARKQMAAMTASFALGQLIGPIFFSSINSLFGASLNFALFLGALLLALGLVPLLRLRRQLEPA